MTVQLAHDKPGVSVIICTWNRQAQLEGTLRLLAAQAGVSRRDFQVVVVDNNSSDGTAALIARLAVDWSLGSLQYEFEPRQGKQFALNRGLAVAHNPVLAFTDDDIVLPADWLSSIQTLFADPGIELAGGITLPVWPDSGPPPWYADDMRAVVGGVDLGTARLDPAPPHFAPAGGNLVARRALFDRLGYFSEAHFRHMDFEFGMRCHGSGARIVYEPSLVVHAPVATQCLTRRYFRRWAFKAGIAPDKDQAVGTRGPTVPRWVYRRALEDALYVLLPGREGDTSVKFSRELRLRRGIGTIANAWYAWAFPFTHGKWVERFSQKTNDVY